MRLFQTSSLVVLTSISGSVMTVLANLFIARALGPSTMGAVSVLIAAPTILAILSTLGLHTAAVYHLGRRTFPLPDILSTVLALLIAVSGFWAVALTLAFPLVHGYIFKNIADQYSVIMLSTLPAQLVTTCFGDIFLSLNRYALFAATRLLPCALYLPGLLVLVLAFHLGLGGVVVAFSGAMFVAALVALAGAYRMGGLQLRFSTAYARTALVFGLKAHVGESAQYCNYRVDLLFVNYFAGLQAAGYYAIAVRIAELLFQISSSMRLVLFTRVVHLTEAERDRLPPFLIRNTLLVTGTVAAALYVASPLAVRLLLPSYLPSIPLLYLLLPGVCLATVFQMVTGALNGRGKPALSMYLMVGGLLLGLTAYFLMIPRFGAQGAALASTAVYTVESLVAAVILCRLLSTPLHLLLVPQARDLSAMWRAGWQMSGNALRLRRLPGAR